ncbi:hypothetical protein ACWCP6_09970 [Streptomyces sp. NPDC002004]
MKKMICAATAMLLALTGSAAAWADATIQDGKVGLSIKGRGLAVTRTGGRMDG